MHTPGSISTQQYIHVSTSQLVLTQIIIASSVAGGTIAHTFTHTDYHWGGTTHAFPTPKLWYVQLLQVNEKFHKLERGYRGCIKRTRDKTRIYSIPHDAPGA